MHTAVIGLGTSGDPAWATLVSCTDADTRGVGGSGLHEMVTELVTAGAGNEVTIAVIGSDNNAAGHGKFILDISCAP